MDAVMRIGLNNAAWAVILALAAAVVARLWQHRPALSHALWLLVLLKLAAPGLVGVSLPRDRVEEPPANESISRAVADDPPSRVLQTLEPAGPVEPGPGEPAAILPISPIPRSEPRPAGPWPWRTILAGLWLTGAGAWWLALAVQTSRFGRLVRAASPAADDLRIRASRIAGRLGLRRCPEILLVPARMPPMLWALFGRPRVLLPEALWAGLDGPQRDAVLAHELAHLRRGDHWVRRLEAVVLGLYWWDPFAWWARRGVERAEELCCDGWVTWALPGSAPAYAEALVATADFLSGPRSPWPLGASGVGRVPLLKGRLTMILRTPIARPSPRWLLIVAALALPLLPAWATAQAPGREPAPAKPAPIQADPDTPRPKPVEAPKVDDKAGPDAASHRVKVARPLVKQVEDYADFNGRIEATKSVEIRARVGGTIESLEVSPGQMVAQGQILFRIDPRVYQAELNRAKAEVDRTQAKKERAATELANTDRLKKANGVSQQEVDLYRAELAQAQAEETKAKASLDIARLNLEFTLVKAPFAGQVGSVLLDAGSVVAADTRPMATLISVDPVRVAFDIDERTLLRLNRRRRQGPDGDNVPLRLPVEVTLAAEQDGKAIRGAVEFVTEQINPATGTARLRAILPNAERDLLPGMSANVQLATGPPHEALLVPFSAMNVPTGFDRAWLEVVNDRGDVERREVRKGLKFGNYREVTGSLKADEWFVVNFQHVYYTDRSHMDAKITAITPERVTLPLPVKPATAGDRPSSK